MSSASVDGGKVSGHRGMYSRNLISDFAWKDQRRESLAHQCVVALSRSLHLQQLVGIVPPLQDPMLEVLRKLKFSISVMFLISEMPGLVLIRVLGHPSPRS